MRVNKGNYTSNEVALMSVLGLIGPEHQKLLTIQTREIREPDPTNMYYQKAEAKRLRKQARNLEIAARPVDPSPYYLESGRKMKAMKK